MLDNTPNQPTTFRTKDCVIISRLCVYSDVYILAKGTISTAAQAGDNQNKNCSPFSDCINKIYNTQINNAKQIDVILSMYNSIEYSDKYSKKSRSLW